MVKVYKPYSSYSQQADTKVEKTNFLTALSTYGKRIIARGQLSSGTTSVTLYTVPEGKAFFLLTSSLSLVITDALGNVHGAFLNVNQSSAAGACFHQLFTRTAGTGVNSSISFPIPLKLTASENVRVFRDLTNGSHIESSVTGYEIDASLIPNFV